MCGLVGIFGNINVTHEKAFNHMLVMSTLRGDDSCGVASVSTEEGAPVTLIKGLGTGYDMICTKKYENLMRGHHRALLGHNRSATKGSVTVANAHPFVFNNIVGMHNGTLSYGTTNVIKNGKSYGTDSEALIAQLDVNEPKDVFLDNMTDDTDAYAVVWYDRRNDTINIIRNDKRTLYGCFTKNKEALFIMSEVEMLNSVVNRNKIECSRAFAFNTDVLYRWAIPNKEQIFGKGAQEKVEPVKEQIGYGFKSWDYKNNCWKKTYYSPIKQQKKEEKKAIVELITHNPTKQTENKKKDKAAKVPISTGDHKGWYQLLDNGYHKVLYDPLARQWLDAWKHGDKWSSILSTLNPSSLPLIKHNLQSSPQYVIQNHKPYAYGPQGKGDLLEQFTFEEAMMYGCTACQRVPEWGNHVHWLSVDGAFLCEYCAYNPELVAQWEEAWKEDLYGDLAHG